MTGPAKTGLNAHDRKFNFLSQMQRQASIHCRACGTHVTISNILMLFFVTHVSCCMISCKLL